MQNTKLIKKISTSLVSTGEIIDSLQSNSSTSAPSIRAVVDNMTPPMNLLINGDFKINQRGQTKYTGGSYSLDMWLLTNGELTKNEIGITLNANHSQYNLILYQFIEPDVFKGDKGVIVAKINGIRHIYKINIGKESQNEPYLFYDEDDINVGSLYFYWNNSRNKYDVYISVNRTRSIQVEYIDLFEGSIAYSHIAEDDAIALLRCQDYEIFYETLLLTISYDYNEQKFQAVANFPKMKDIPTFTHGLVEMWANTGSFMQIGVESKEALIDRIRITTQTTPYARKSGTCIIFLHNVNLTCEPL